MIDVSALAGAGQAAAPPGPRAANTPQEQTGQDFSAYLNRQTTEGTQPMDQALRLRLARKLGWSGSESETEVPAQAQNQSLFAAFMLQPAQTQQQPEEPAADMEVNGVVFPAGRKAQDELRDLLAQALGMEEHDDFSILWSEILPIQVNLQSPQDLQAVLEYAAQKIESLTGQPLESLPAFTVALRSGSRDTGGLTLPNNANISEVKQFAAFLFLKLNVTQVQVTEETLPVNDLAAPAETPETPQSTETVQAAQTQDAHQTEQTPAAQQAVQVQSSPAAQTQDTKTDAPAAQAAAFAERMQLTDDPKAAAASLATQTDNSVEPEVLPQESAVNPLQDAASSEVQTIQTEKITQNTLYQTAPQVEPQTAAAVILPDTAETSPVRPEASETTGESDVPVLDVTGKAETDITLQMTDTETAPALQAAVRSDEEPPAEMTADVPEESVEERGSTEPLRAASTETKTVETVNNAPAAKANAGKTDHNEAQNTLLPNAASTVPQVTDIPLENAAQETQSEQSSRIINQITEQIYKQQGETVTKLEMQLHPASLGRIVLSLERSSEGVSVTLKSASDSVRETLASHMADLQSALKDAGINMKDLRIEQPNVGWDLARGAPQQGESRSSSRDGGRDGRRSGRVIPRAAAIENHMAAFFYGSGVLQPQTTDTSLDLRA